jgi:hypothetical protein
MEYRIILDRKVVGLKNGTGYITEEGAKIIYDAYVKMWGCSQTMERREERGGIAWLSEIVMFREKGFLPKDFNWMDYMVRLENFKS